MAPRVRPERRRSRAEKRLVRLRQRYEWGDIGDAEYRRKIEECQADLAALPEAGKVVGFDDVARIVASLPAALVHATPDQKKRLMGLVVESVGTRDREARGVVIVPAARPFFAGDDLLMAPPDALGHPTATQRARLVPRGGLSVLPYPAGGTSWSGRED